MAKRKVRAKEKAKVVKARRAQKPKLLVTLSTEPDQVCWACRGTGRVYNYRTDGTKRCVICRGSGRIPSEDPKTFTFEVWKGKEGV